jgi:Tol biopolymer transport system component
VTVNPDGSGEAVLVVMDEENRSPAWSPDSTMITFMSQFNNPCCENWQVWAMNSDGSGAK